MFYRKHMAAVAVGVALIAAMASPLLSVTPVGAASAPATISLVPAILHINTTSTLAITGSAVSGGVVTTTSPELISIGAVTPGVDSQNLPDLNVVITVGTFTGSVPTSANITVTIPGSSPETASLTIDPTPTVTGGPYYTATASTNLEVTINGTFFSTSGVTASSTNPDFSAHVVSTTATVANLLVSNTSADVNGTFTTITLIDPDGSYVSFTLNGGAPISKPTATLVPATLHAGTSSVLTINGGPFMPGAVVSTTTPYIITPGATTVVSSTQITVPITVGSVAGSVAVPSNITINNPDGGVVSTTLTIAPDPIITGTYYVTPGGSNVEITVTGTNLSATGVTAMSNNLAFTVVVVSSTTGSTTLLVTNTAVVGGSAKITLTNPDGSSASFPLDAGTPVVPISRPSVGISPGSLHASTTSTVIISGGPFTVGAAVTSSSPELLSIGTVSFVSASELTAVITVFPVTGAATVAANVTVTNPDTGAGVTSLTIYPDPAITGAYSVPPSTTNYELTVTGTYLSATGVTAKSNNTNFKVIAESSTTSSVSMLVTTTAASAGSSATITVANPDGSSTTFVLHSTVGGTTSTTVPKSSTTSGTLVVHFAARSTAISAAVKAKIVAYCRKVGSSGKMTVRGYASTSKGALTLVQAIESIARKLYPRMTIYPAVTVSSSLREAILSRS